MELVSKIGSRWQLHLLFWLSYVALETYFEFAWIQTSFKGQMPQWKIFSVAFLSESSLLPHKITLTYFIFWILTRREKLLQSWFITFSAILLGFGFAIILQRIVVVYLILPILYAEAPESQLVFDINRINSTIGDLLFVVGVATAVKQFRNQQRSKEHERNLNKEKLEAELRFLRNQTNPHFLFNTLNNIYALARKKADETPEVIMKLSQLLRFMLYECKRDTIALYEEIKVIEDYIALEKIRYYNKLRLSFKKEIEHEGEEIAPLILLPFVENAFKHGASESRFGAYINLHLVVKNGLLNFTIENSKEASHEPEKEGIGLQNIRRQLELMYQDFNLEIENDLEKFSVRLYIDLRSKTEIK